MIRSMNASGMTTIKVPVALRDRLRERAEAQHITQAEALERLLENAEDQRIDAFVAEAFDRWQPALDKLA